MQVERAAAVVRVMRKELNDRLTASTPGYRGPIPLRNVDMYQRLALQERIQALDVMLVLYLTEGEPV